MKNPTNPKKEGLYYKYQIRKIVGWKARNKEDILQSQPITKAIDPDSEYFVLRLDKNGKDPIHIAACRKAILVYANEIKDHLPKLSQDLFRKYGDEY